MISKFLSVLACVDKNIAFKFIGVALRLLNSQWKMHHCDVLCLVISFLCSLQAYNYTEHLYFCALNSSPPTHFTRAPPSPAKNRYLNSILMILHQVSWQQSYSTRSRVQDVRRSRLQSYSWFHFALTKHSPVIISCIAYAVLVLHHANYGNLRQCYKAKWNQLYQRFVIVAHVHGAISKCLTELDAGRDPSNLSYWY